jgi:hypothetical protein
MALAFSLGVGNGRGRCTSPGRGIDFLRERGVAPELAEGVLEDEADGVESTFIGCPREGVSLLVTGFTGVEGRDFVAIEEVAVDGPGAFENDIDFRDLRAAEPKKCISQFENIES